ncbi:MAG: amino acid adenylation domain-containing protein, partial [Clostridium sp.]|nr:amino acid adenylation domain-containing protein [Clostridium sp.]
DKYPVDNNSAYLFKTSYTFDVSLNELFGWIFNGGKLIILAKGEEKEPLLIAETIDKYSITHVVFVPSMLKLFLNTIRDRKEYSLSSVNYFVTCGEAIDFETASLCLNLFPNTKLINLYGPTEATIYSTEYEIDARVKKSSIPIGKPLANYKAYIFDENMNLQSLGVPGELYIAGEGLARGYKNREDLTKLSYIKNPYNENELIYKTGDMARWLSDGNIECMGRIDDQVKVRGFRIELGEIENSIRKLDYIKDVAVITRVDSSLEREVYAYIVSEEQVDISKVREEIRRELPEYMMPAYFMQINTIPLSASGKLDKRALPEIIKKSEREYIAPENDTEELICNAFSEILSLERVGINDNFFELGGNSLRAVRLANSIENLFKVRIQLKNIFELQIPKLLAELVLNSEKTTNSSIPKAEEKEEYLMSSAQKRLFLIDKIDDTKIAYNMPCVLDIGNDIDIEKINQVFRKIVERHDILRTSFHMEGEAVQRIHKHVEVNFEFEDIRGKSKEESQKILKSFVRKFDLSKAPLIRGKIVKTDDTNLLLFDMHHIITDGWSMNLLINEFNDLYEGKELEDIRVSYKDYSEWMNTRDLTEEKNYWLKQFEDEVESLNLPLDFPRGQQQNFVGSSIKYVTGIELTNKVKALAKETNTTEYMVLLTALMVLLKKYSRQEDIVVGSPIAGRTHKDTENMLGMFVNTLALRGKAEDEKEFDSFLNEMREVTLNAYKNQEYPFEELIEELGIKRDLSRNALFDVMFVMQNNEETSLSISKNNNFELDINSEITKFDITISIIPCKKGYEIIFEYRSDLYKKSTIENMINHYINIVSQILEEKKLKIKDIVTVTKEEKNKILNEFNFYEERYPKELTVMDLFEENIAKNPDNIAVEFEDEKVTYLELNEKANELARKILNLGTKKGDFIAVMTQKSINTIIAICAIVKSGCAYVPIDTSYPLERIDYMIHDSKPKAVLSDNFKYETDIPVIDISNAVNMKGIKENINVGTKYNDLIYVIYTSGTTGRPKGVMIENKGVVNLVHKQNYMDFKDISLYQAGSLSFDAATFEIWGPLLNGGKIHFEDKNVILDVNALKNVVEKYNINTMLLTTSLFNKLIDLDVEVFKNFKHVLYGGEKASEIHLNKLLKVNKNVKLINVYGPTEGTTFTTTYGVKGRVLEEEIPIGINLLNVKCYVLDQGHLCGIGVPGELFFEGINIARGYLNRDELTKEKFIDNPFGEGKIYATGDLVKWMPDGNIKYLGRIDEQVKFRGFRIELGEIENSIKNIKEVRDCVVIFREDGLGEKALYGYVVKDEEITMDKVKDEIKKVLPEYMIPGYMMFIDNIPLTINGKVNKKELPEIELESSKEYKAPETYTEKVVSEIFMEVLNIKRVGLNDNFFELGGHSIKALSTVNRINKELNSELSVKDLFILQTVGEISKKIDKVSKHEKVSISKAEEKESYIISPGQKRMLIVNSMDENSTSYNMPFKLKATGEFDVDKFKEAILKVINRHESLRTKFILTEEGARQVINSNLNIEIPVVKASEVNIDELFNSFIKPFNLEKNPLIRCMIVEVKSNLHYVFIDMHHILADGASVSIIVKDLLDFYNGETLDNLSYQYKDYCEWLHKEMSSEKYEKSREYWLNKFKDEVPELNINKDAVRKELVNCQCGNYASVIENDVFLKAKEVITKMNISWYMLLLNSYSILLHKFSGQNDIVIGSPILGRDKEEWKSVVGMFVNMIPIYCKIDDEMSIEDYLYNTKDQCINSYENEIYQFDELVEELNIDRKSDRNPIFDVTLSMQNLSMPELKAAGLNIEIEGYSKQSKYDLMLFAMEENKKLHFEFEYRKDLFDEKLIEEMSDALVKIVEFIIDNLDKKVKDISLIDEETALNMKSQIEEDRNSFDFDFDF